MITMISILTIPALEEAGVEIEAVDFRDRNPGVRTDIGHIAGTTPMRDLHKGLDIAPGRETTRNLRSGIVRAVATIRRMNQVNPRQDRNTTGLTHHDSRDQDPVAADLL